MNNILKFAFTLPTDTTARSGDLILPENASTPDEQQQSGGFFKRFWIHAEDLSKADTKPFEGLL